jgi:hypothetical protein
VQAKEKNNCKVPLDELVGAKSKKSQKQKPSHAALLESKACDTFISYFYDDIMTRKKDKKNPTR